MKFEAFLKLCLVLVTFLCLQGCDQGGPSERLDLKVQNSSTSEIDGACVAWAKQKVIFGVVGKGFGATRMHYTGPLTPAAQVSWSSSDGKMHQQSVNIDSIYNRKKSVPGVLIFEITGDSVVARFEPL